jgi:N-methylhydantoinase B
VLRDVVEDYVSLQGARRDYGVVIDPATMTVDEPATAAARAIMRRDGPLPAVTRRGPLW